MLRVERLKKKREEAIARQVEFDKLSLDEKYAKLVAAGHGHCKEAKKYLEINGGYFH